MEEAKVCTLELDDFTLDEVDKDYKPYFIDPGWKHVFTAIAGTDEVRRYSSKEYYTMTGSVQRNNAFDREKKRGSVEEIETSIPTAKAANVENYNDFVTYMLLNLNVLFAFYGLQRAEGPFHLYQGQQRAKEKMVNMILNGDTKYSKKRRRHTNKNRRRRNNTKAKREKCKGQELKELKKKDPDKFEPYIQERDKKKGSSTRERKWTPYPFEEDKDHVPLIVFGAAIFGKDQTRIKGLRSGVVGLLWRTLTKRAKETKSLIALSTDEYNTSKFCSGCGEKDTNVAPKTKGVGVLECSKCKIIWNRDLNAAKNMHIISNTIWSGNERLQIYKPKKKSAVNQYRERNHKYAIVLNHWL